MPEQGNKNGLRTFLYIFNILLIMKAVFFIAYILYALFFSVTAIIIVYALRDQDSSEDHIWLIPGSFISFGIASLVFAIIGMVGTAKEHSPTLIANAVLLMLLLLAEVAICVVVGVTSLPVAALFLAMFIAGAVVTMITFSLTLAWNTHVRNTRNV